MITFEGKLEEVVPAPNLRMVYVYKTEDDGILWATRELAETWNKAKTWKAPCWYTRLVAFVVQGETDRVWFPSQTGDWDSHTVNLKFTPNEEEISSLRKVALGKLKPKEREVLGLA